MRNLDLLKFESENGIIGRKVDNKRKIIRHLCKYKESLTIPEIATLIDLVNNVNLNTVGTYTASFYRR